MGSSASVPSRKCVGIDASNLRGGGGVTHIRQMLSAAEPQKAGFERVVIWGSAELLATLPQREWLVQHPMAKLEHGPMARLLFQHVELPKRLVTEGCGILMSPGGTLPQRSPVPTITFCRNMLPYELDQLRLYPVLSLSRLRLHLLRYLQARSFRSADAVIFLTEYARTKVCQELDMEPMRHRQIPHGIHERFFSAPRKQKALSQYTWDKPFTILYVSIVDVYKHQWNVVDALHRLRQRGLPVSVRLVGPSYEPALDRLQRIMNQRDVKGRLVTYEGNIDFDELHHVYTAADLFVFASSCENLPNILLEAMAAGLPIACSEMGPMREVLGDGGEYFSPYIGADIAAAVGRLALDEKRREHVADLAFSRAKSYSWQACADATFQYARAILEDAGKVGGRG